MAEEVLRVARKPLTPRAILKAAYTMGIASSRLHGKTQHKTLQARLSEDILVRRERSAFFRTAPGYFFLTALVDDESLPESYRRPVIARRRRRELPYRNALAIHLETLGDLVDHSTVPSNALLRLIGKDEFHYARSSAQRTDQDVLIWSFVIVTRDRLVLTYRHGHYREGRDGFLQRRSVGFFTPVVDTDMTLFDRADHGIVGSGLRALATDLNMTDGQVDLDVSQYAALDCFISTSNGVTHDLLGIVHFEPPEWFEPFTRRLAINDLKWMDVDRVNHFEDFDPWSQLVLERAQRGFESSNV
ncbi:MULTISPECIES: winged helix-turn-helix domain-containing protein [unclassified Mesorhizobium]|uniref:winged helix-turn-helix domain-containing protein n=1 Tax=unclassified Mesorhizobium TaxID=325217 RepID=UPI001CCE9C90|nr:MULTISPECIES: winged helix-turn-helix domain-containing protein [unclassified Mesorhizobium]MBZ9683089.1 winged helix-turn-helix domain-containing protein [Mesorhizobium sp. CO1-1-2]MBZ9924381.1 winged helix-turn-helix domain-containing protein [Mesorhizobium sp. BR1-1-4]